MQNRKNYLAGVFLLAISLVACSSGSSQAPAPSYNYGAGLTSSMIVPADNAADVSTHTNIQLQFSAPALNVDSNNVILHEGSISGNSVAISPIISGANNTFTFNPVGGLKQNTDYFVEVESGVTSATGVPLASSTFTFTTNDTANPGVVILTPANDESGISLSPVISLAFSEAVQNVSTATVSLHAGSATGSLISINSIMAGDNNTYSFTPAADLNSATAYYVVITNGITDSAGLALDNTTFNFNTGVFNEWAWMSGSPFSYQQAVGTLGVAAAVNAPENKASAGTWVDNQGNLWLFGGFSTDKLDNRALTNDLWKYNLLTNEWTLMKGVPGVLNQFGIYGHKGKADLGSIPGGRLAMATWVDTQGNLWLFGGVGIGATPGGDEGVPNDSLNDLWKYNVQDNTWTWMGGSQVVNQPGVYGDKGIESSDNIPGAHGYPGSWVDSQGNFWLFGGLGEGSMTGIETDALNDLWKYNVQDNTWTWMGGSQVVNQPGVYGNKGKAGLGNIPGGRYQFSTLNVGNKVWVFGGSGFDSVGTPYKFLNDLWQYDMSTNEWTWLSGSDRASDLGVVYGVKGVADSANVPPSLDYAISWADQTGGLWFFGGLSTDNSGTYSSNILWQYNTLTNEWTWVSGDMPVWSQSSGQTVVLPNYGVLGVMSPDNALGQRYASSGWTDKQGNFWLFGGLIGVVGPFKNDLWRYVVSQ